MNIFGIILDAITDRLDGRGLLVIIIAGLLIATVCTILIDRLRRHNHDH